MICAPVRSIIPSLKLEDYLSVQAHKPCSISHLLMSRMRYVIKSVTLFNQFNVFNFLASICLSSKMLLDIVPASAVLKDVLPHYDIRRNFVIDA